MSDPLLPQLKKLIVETLKLEHVRPEDIPDDEQLFGGGLGLDSIDGLELVVRIEKAYGLKISSAEESRAALASVAKLAEFIRSRAPADKLPA